MLLFFCFLPTVFSELSKVEDGPLFNLPQISQTTQLSNINTEMNTDDDFYGSTEDRHWNDEHSLPNQDQDLPPLSLKDNPKPNLILVEQNDENLNDNYQEEPVDEPQHVLTLLGLRISRPSTPMMLPFGSLLRERFCQHPEAPRLLQSILLSKLQNDFAPLFPSNDDDDTLTVIKHFQAVTPVGTIEGSMELRGQPSARAAKFSLVFQRLANILPAKDDNESPENLEIPPFVQDVAQDEDDDLIATKPNEPITNAESKDSPPSIGSPAYPMKHGSPTPCHDDAIRLCAESNAKGDVVATLNCLLEPEHRDLLSADCAQHLKSCPLVLCLQDILHFCPSDSTHVEGLEQALPCLGQHLKQLSTPCLDSVAHQYHMSLQNNNENSQEPLAVIETVSTAKTSSTFTSSITKFLSSLTMKEVAWLIVGLAFFVVVFTMMSAWISRFRQKNRVQVLLKPLEISS